VKADALIRWLMPKDDRFRSLFRQGTSNLKTMTESFREIALAASLDEMRLRATQLKDLEHEGDRVTREVFEALNTTFVTPLDREDIRELATDLDNIVDGIDEVGQFLVLLQLTEQPTGLGQFAEILEQMASELDRATGLIWSLSGQLDAQSAIVRISDLENRADDLYAALLADLFKGDGRNAIEVLKWKEIYDGLENACDGCKEYSHVIANVLMKSA
jgi:predicted phosphate transport protein (TIGR00153 family)